MSQGSPSDIERTTPEADISLGREMRRAREVRGITIQQIAQETKINERYIHALENDRLDLLPGQPYVSNFVRSIARCIGADEEELLDYLNYQRRTLYPERSDEARSVARDRPRRGMPLILGVGAVLVIVLLTIALRDGGDDPDQQGDREPREGRSAAPRTPRPEPPSPEGTAAPGIDTATAAPVAVPPPALLAVATPVVAGGDGAAAVPGASGPDAAASDLTPAPTVRLVFREKSWVEIQQQGDENPRLGIIDPGAELSWTLDRPLSMKITNAGGVDMYIDGQAAKPLGGPRETRTIALDRKNWKSYLR